MADETPDKVQPDIVIGATGLKRFGGYISEEWHPRLAGGKAVKVFTEMKDNDAIVGAVLYVIESLILQAAWTVVPAGEDSRAQEQAAFVEGCLTDMSHSWGELVAEILTMLPYGWAYFELVYKQRRGAKGESKSKFDDHKFGWRKISIRAQDTLMRWEFDEDGGIRGMWQMAPPTFKVVYIPIEKALLFRTRSHKNNPEGRSLLRNAYRSWYFLKRIQEIEAIGVERDLAGLPVIEVPPEIMHPDAPAGDRALRTSLERLVQQVRRDEREGLVIPSETDPATGKATGYKFKLLSTGGRRSLDVNQIVTRYEERIAMTLLAQFILLGTKETGSFALASSQTNLFAVALGATMDMIGDVFNRFAIPRLMELNGIPQELWPTVQHGDIEAPSLTEVATYINQLVGAGVLTPDDGLEAKLREYAKLPPKAAAARDSV